MTLTPQARRLISAAVGALPDAAHEKWRAWVVSSPTGDLPYDVAVIALEALEATARRLEGRLEEESLDEDIEADILNDLGYIHAIESGLRQQGIGR